MLPDLRLVIVAVAVTILVVIKFGADLASMLSDPYVEAPGRRLANQHMLPENPNHRQQLQTLAAARRVDELHRLLDLPTGTVTTFIDTTAGGGNIGGPFVGAGGTAQRSNRVRAAQPTRDNSSDVVPHAARSADATRLAMTASPSPARTAAIADQRDRLAPSESQAAPAAPAPPPGSAAAAPDAAVASEDDTRRVAAVSPPDQADDLVTPTDIPLLKRVPMPRARIGIHAAAIHARARRLVARKPTLPDNPFAVLFGMGAAGN